MPPGRERLVDCEQERPSGVLDADSELKRRQTTVRDPRQRSDRRDTERDDRTRPADPDLSVLGHRPARTVAVRIEEQSK
jgi:hypothetical protein